MGRQQGSEQPLQRHTDACMILLTSAPEGARMLCWRPLAGKEFTFSWSTPKDTAGSHLSLHSTERVMSSLLLFFVSALHLTLVSVLGGGGGGGRRGVL